MDNNSSNQPEIDRHYPVLRTIELDHGLTVTGFICSGFPKDKECHRQEFPGLHEYNLRLDGADGSTQYGNVNTDMDELKKPHNAMFSSPVSLPLFDMSTNYKSYEGRAIRDVRPPTQDEFIDFMQLPKIKEASAKFQYFPFDVTGHRILTADEWNRLPEEEIKLRSQTITAQVTDREGKTFSVDYNLQKPLQRILNAGFNTGQSDSGTISDHPGYRYVEDSKTGRFRKGDLIEASVGSYLTFWKPQTKLFPHNTQQQIDQIVTQAKATGWRVQEMDIFFEPSIRICLPETLDGSSHQELLKEATTIMNERFPNLTLHDNLDEWLDKRGGVIEEVIKEHGGRKKWTDGEVLERWNELSKRLEWVAKIEETTGWLTGNDVHSILLTPEESKKLESELEEKKLQTVLSGQTESRIYQERLSRMYDEVAHKYGFASFDENEEGTGVRNYTALGKRANEETKKRLDAYKKESFERLDPLMRTFAISSERVRLMLNNLNQEYLQKIYAITHPRAVEKKAARLKERISDVSIYKFHGYSPFLYRIRCKIDGEQKQAKLMHASDGNLELNGNEKILMAAKYFKDELENEQSRNRDKNGGMKR